MSDRKATAELPRDVLSQPASNFGIFGVRGVVPGVPPEIARVEAGREAQDRQTYSWEGQNLQARLTQEKIKRWTEYLRAGKVAQETFLENVLGMLDIERTPDGKVVLYHATPSTGLREILTDHAIKPSQETGKKAWGSVDDDKHVKPGHDFPSSKIYLGKKGSIKTVAGQMQNRIDAGTIYILKVITDPSKLRPDEDNQVYENDEWAISLASGAKTCSYRGNITDFGVVERLPIVLPIETRRQYIRSEVNETTQEGKNAVKAGFRKEQEAKFQEEARTFQQIGLDISTLPVMK